MDFYDLRDYAKDNGLRISDMLAMSPKNDPFYMGTPAAVRNGNWFAELYYRLGFSADNAPHLRRVHYIVMSQSPAVSMPSGEPYLNTDNCWNFIGEASKAARYLGLIPMNGLVDNKNPSPHVHATYSTAKPGFRMYLQEPEAPYAWIDGFNVPNYQPYHTEIWCEKSTINDILIPLANQYGANVVTFEGEVSITSVYVSLMNRIQAAEYKPVRIGYISDFDPAGNSMPVAMSRKLEKAIYDSGDPELFDVKVRPLALSADQVRDHRIPRTPIKDTELRGAKFEQNFGEGAAELDALVALRPGVLNGIVEDFLQEYYDYDMAEQVENAEQEYRDAIQAQVDQVSAKYADLIESLKAMHKELGAIKVSPDEFLPERPDGEVWEVDEDWLFDSSREYVDQLAYYRQHKGRE